MPGYEDQQAIGDKISIVLTGPDGKVKDERTPEDIAKYKEEQDAGDKRPGPS